jgi:SpoVK/Ycf46/Vps4 family AAA+-type ATPase
MDFKTKIGNYFNAGYPAVQILTYEEQRLMNDLKDVFGKENLIAWTMTQGYHEIGSIKLENPPVDAFDGLSQINQQNKKVIVFYDIEELTNAPEIKRKIRDILPVFENTGKKAIFITKKKIDMAEIVEMEYDLPDVEGRNKILEGILKSNPDVKVSGKIKKQMVQVSAGLTCEELKNTFSLAAIENKGFNGKTVKAIQRLKIEILQKGGTLQYYEPDSETADVGGNKGLMDYIEKRKSLFSEDAKKAGIPTPKGVILTGVSGTGKSLSAKVIASLLGIPLLRLNVGALFGGLVGKSEENLRDALKKVDVMSPCVLWIDEIEKAFGGIKSGNTGSDVPQRIFGELLTWMTETKSEVFKIATCNNMDVLPAEITNRTRFDEVFFLDLPSKEERKEVLEIHLKKQNQSVGEDAIEAFATSSDGYTPSEIEQIVKDAVINSYYNKEKVTGAYLQESISNIKPISKIMEADITKLRTMARDRYRFANGNGNSSSSTVVKDNNGRKLNV